MLRIQAAGYKRMVAFDRILLAPGEAKTVTLRIDPTLLSIYDKSKDEWDLLPGEYKILAGPSSSETPLTEMFHMRRQCNPMRPPI